jgi:creatinine deaminase
MANHATLFGTSSSSNLVVMFILPRAGGMGELHEKAKAMAMESESKNEQRKFEAMLKRAIEEARRGLAEGGIPIGAALFDSEGRLLGSGHNRRVQEGDPSAHGETDAFRRAGRQRSYRDKIMATTLAPCWYCSGLIRQFGIGTVIVGEAVNFRGGIDWLEENGVRVIDLHSEECIAMLAKYKAQHPEVWKEDIGEE